ncbi:MAG: hypothetical protein ACKVY0_28375 [Prosthecobacter sp.]|uniref:hypothetical protein n=1 Tax=Prosthecobacter sp. TaxID=1965333 RepID=UPI003901F7BE
MKATLDTRPLYPSVDYKRALAAIRRVIAESPNTPEEALKWLAATGMHDPKTGRLKKKFR